MDGGSITGSLDRIEAALDRMEASLASSGERARHAAPAGLESRHEELKSAVETALLRIDALLEDRRP